MKDDEYSDPSNGTGTKGKIVTTGTASYLDGLTLPDDFKENNPATLAHILPSTTTIHSMEGGSPTVSHNLTAEWDCCPAKTEATRFTSQT